ncbi:DUF1836 domain-containing protein [Romboutsia sp.]|uniref:DUF1836 domain-containing protein n=1 Tax=Romboutsia sp. TaxID=1965302 RepID=UPI003F38B5ED
MDKVEFHCPRYNELPHIPLYKEQVISFIEEALKDININTQEKLLTSTMVNNYVKQKIVEPPKDKRYTDKHLAYFIVVCVLKQVFSLTEICKMIRMQIDTCPIEQAYDYFCVELEEAINQALVTRDFSQATFEGKRTLQGEMTKSAAMSFANKLYLQKCIIDKQ